MEKEEILSAYSKLWAAVENGNIDNLFFELRSEFRQIMSDE